MKAAGRPIFAAIRGRTYAAQAAAARSETGGALSAQETKVTRLPSGTVVASLENYSPISRVGVFYNAGSRCETGDNLGITHALRSAVNLSTQNQTQFAIARSVQQIGGTLSCSTTREHMIYTIECLRNGLDTGIEFLQEVSSSPAFKTWELGDIADRQRLDLANLATQPQVRMMEALHEAAFRNALGCSLYATPSRTGTATEEDLANFVQNFYTSGNMAIVGVGVDHDQLLFAAKKFKLAQGDSTIPPAKYAAGEVRIDESGPLASAAIVTQGASMNSPDVLALAVLQHVMGTGPYVKYGTNMSTSKVAKAAASGTAAPFAASCINASYSDAGIFGFQVVSQANDMAGALKAVVAAFSEATKGSITDADVQRAKNQLKAAVLMEAENGAVLLEYLGTQAALTGSIDSVSTSVDAINKITLADVQNVAKKVINSGKPTMAAVGNLSNTPYLDELL